MLKALLISVALLIPASSQAKVPDGLDPLDFYAAVTVLDVYVKECQPKGFTPLSPTVMERYKKMLADADPQDIAAMRAFLFGATNLTLDKLCDIVQKSPDE